MSSSHISPTLAQAYFELFDISIDGAQTFMSIKSPAFLTSPLFDEANDCIYFPLLLPIMEYWYQQKQITRLVHVENQYGQQRSFNLLNSGLLMWMFKQEQLEEIESSPFHSYDWAHLTINLQGNLSYKVGHDRYQVNSANGMLTYCKTGYVSNRIHNEEYETSVSILFDPKWLNEKLGEQQDQLMPLLARDEDGSPVTQLFKIDGRCVEIAKQIINLNHTDPFYFLEVEALVNHLLYQGLDLLRQQTLKEGESHRFRVSDIEKLTSVKLHIESNYSTNYSLLELSREFGINRRKLTEGFKGLFGATVNEYVLKQRMSKAAKMIKQGELATTVAHRVGYKEQSSFTRAFKRYYGVLPRDFNA